MAEHYYTSDPAAPHDERDVTFSVLGHTITCATDAGVFSRDGLDMGTRVMLEALPSLGGRILDLGCGWGAVGVSVALACPDAEIVMTDVNRRATELAARNLARNNIRGARVVCGDGFEAVDGKFDMILLNPPIRTGKAVIYRLFSDARAFLSDCGRLYIVIRKQQGAESAERYLKGVYASVARIARDKGYWVFECKG